MLDRTTLAGLIDACQLSNLKQAILDLALPSIRLHSEPVRDETAIPVGASKLGGLPDLPPGMEYPRHKGKTLDFIAQINLAEIQGYGVSRELPSSGLLQFFYGIDFSPEARAADDVVHWMVLLHESDPANLRRSSVPSSNPYGHFKPCRIDFGLELTIPPRDSVAAENRLGVGYGSESPYAEGYHTLVAEIWDRDPRRIFNRMFGYANPVQGDVFKEAGAALRGAGPDDGVIPPPQDWVLLLQVDSDDYAEMMWGDVGMLYYCIRREDLAAQRFDQITCIMQEN